MRKIITAFVGFCLLAAASAPAALAQEKKSVAKNFQAFVLINDGKDTKQKRRTLQFSETSFSVRKGKKGVIIKQFNYADIESTDYTYDSKPLLSSKMHLAALLGIYTIPLMFLKIKYHWLTVRTKDDFVVIRLVSKKNQILNEFASRKISSKNL